MFTETFQEWRLTAASACHFHVLVHAVRVYRLLVLILQKVLKVFIVSVNSDDERLLTKTMTKENARDAYLAICLEEWTSDKIIQRSCEVKIPVCVVVRTFHKNETENAKLF